MSSTYVLISTSRAAASIVCIRKAQEFNSMLTTTRHVASSGDLFTHRPAAVLCSVLSVRSKVHPERFAQPALHPWPRISSSRFARPFHTQSSCTYPNPVNLGKESAMP
eukprot:4528027-Amphidinium_carterae.1